MNDKNKLSKTNKVLVISHDRGYRVLNGVVYNPKGEPVRGSYRKAAPSYRKAALNVYYHYFSYNYNGQSVSLMVHKLVAYQKFGDLMFRPSMVVRHINGNSLDNSEGNIEIGTILQNTMDRTPESRREHAIKASSHIYKFKDEELLRNFLNDRASGMVYRELMEKYSLSKSTVSYLLNKIEYVRKFAEREGISFN